MVRLLRSIIPIWWYRLTAIVPYCILFIESLQTTALIMCIGCQFLFHFNSIQHSGDQYYFCALNCHFVELKHQLPTCNVLQQKFLFFTSWNKYLTAESNIPNSRRPGIAWHKCSLISFTDTPHEVMVVSLRFSCILNWFALKNSVAISGVSGKRSTMDFVPPLPLFFSVGCFASGIALSSARFLNNECNSSHSKPI